MIKLKRLLFEDRSDDILKELEVHKKSAFDLIDKIWSHPDGSVFKATVAHILYKSALSTNKSFKETTASVDRVFKRMPFKIDGTKNPEYTSLTDFDKKNKDAAEDAKEQFNDTVRRSKEEFESSLEGGVDKSKLSFEDIMQKNKEEFEKVMKAREMGERDKYEDRKKSLLSRVRFVIFSKTDGDPPTTPEVTNLIKESEKTIDEYIEVYKKIDKLTEEMKKLGKEDIIKKFYSDIIEKETSTLSSSMEKLPEVMEQEGAKIKQALVDRQKKYSAKLESEVTARRNEYIENYRKWLSGSQTTPPPIPPPSVYEIDKELGGWMNFKG